MVAGNELEALGEDAATVRLGRMGTRVVARAPYRSL